MINEVDVSAHEGVGNESKGNRVLPSWMTNSENSSGKGAEKSQKSPEGVGENGVSERSILPSPHSSNGKSHDKDTVAYDHKHIAEAASGNISENSSFNVAKDTKTAERNSPEHQAADKDEEYVGNELCDKAANVPTADIEIPSKENQALSSGEERAPPATTGSTEREGQAEEKSKPPREPCTFGAKCYRKSKDHFEARSHPGDEDFVDNRPECEFGLACYRKNILHHQNFKHTGGFLRKKRKPDSQRKASANDDLEYDESDISLSDSDGYEPTSEEESLSSSEVEEDEGGDSATETKPKTRKKRKLA